MNKPNYELIILLVFLAALALLFVFPLTDYLLTLLYLAFLS